MYAQDLLFMDEFAIYRQREIEEAVIVANEIFKSSLSPDYIKGAMFMLKRILQIPMKLAQTDEAKVRAEDIIEKDFKEFQAQFVKIRYDEES